MFTQNIIEIMIWGIGGVLIIKDEFTLGVLYSYIMYVGFFHNSISNITLTWKEYCENRVSIDVIRNCIKEMAGEENIDYCDNKIVRRIEVKKLQFGYEDITIFNNASAVFQSDRPNYIIGKSGVGKTTLLRLLMGVYECSDGDIHFQEENDVYTNFAEKYKCISWVPQEPIIFNDTLIRNLTFGKAVNPEKLDEICSECGLRDFIDNLPEKYETVLSSDGQNLSLGEMQRISLARAVLQDNPIVFIDEMTSSLDPYTKELLNMNIGHILKDKLIIIVSHDVKYIPEDAHVYEVKDKKIFCLK